MPSTAIRRIAYAPKDLRLTVVFVTGRTYDYRGVPATVVEAFRAAPSKGVFFNRHIRDRYPFRELARKRKVA